MTDRQKLLREVQKLAFAKLETQLYLDGHPDDENALAYLKELTQKVQEAVDAFQEKFGSLTGQLSEEDEGEEGWTWVQDPWPWEKEAN